MNNQNDAELISAIEHTSRVLTSALEAILTTDPFEGLSFTADRYERAVHLHGMIERHLSEIAEDDGIPSIDALRMREPYERNLVRVERFISDCRDHLALRGDQ